MRAVIVAFWLQSASEEALIIGQEEKSTAFFRLIAVSLQGTNSFDGAFPRLKPWAKHSEAFTAQSLRQNF